MDVLNTWSYVLNLDTVICLDKQGVKWTYHSFMTWFLLNWHHSLKNNNVRCLCPKLTGNLISSLSRLSVLPVIVLQRSSVSVCVCACVPAHTITSNINNIIFHRSWECLPSDTIETSLGRWASIPLTPSHCYRLIATLSARPDAHWKDFIIHLHARLGPLSWVIGLLWLWATPLPCTLALVSAPGDLPPMPQSVPSPWWHKHAASQGELTRGQKEGSWPSALALPYCLTTAMRSVQNKGYRSGKYPDTVFFISPSCSHSFCSQCDTKSHNKVFIGL